MNNCLVTKLSDVVNNDNLKKVDEIVITTKTIDATDYANFDALKRISVRFKNTASYVRTTGNGRVNTSVELLASNPLSYIEIPANTDVTLYFSNDDYNIFIDKKKDLKRLAINGYGDAVKQSLFYFNLNEIAYSSLLNCEIQFQYSQSKGDISVLSGMTGLKTMMFTNTEGITGDLSNFIISDNLGIGGSRIYGDFTNAVKYPSSPGQPFNGSAYARTRDGEITVDFSQANNFSRAWYDKSNLYQDITCTWTTTRSYEYNILALKSGSNGKFDFGTYLDAMLNNQAQCPLKSGATGDYALIDVWGTRTSASDAAVATLKGKGVTVKINGVTL